ncbi:MAG: GNAT family N-acetyltransferase [Candidatus Buchananbacteria bacterium]
MIKYRKFKNSDIPQVCELILATYKKFNHKKNSPKMLEKYLDCYSPKRNSLAELKTYFAKAPIHYLALDGKKIIGTVRGRADRLVNLYVDGRYHKQGIGRNLVIQFEKEAKKLRPKKIKINASIFAVRFYQKLGFKKSTGQRKIFDLLTQPMIKRF